MRELSKYHTYSLFLSKETSGTLIFKNPKIFSIILSGAVSLTFFSVYIFFVNDMPESDNDKIYLMYFTLGLGSIATLAAFKFIVTSEALTIRKPMNSIIYEYRTLTGVKGWKRQISDFEYLDVYTSITNKSGGAYVGNDSHWIFDLVTNNGFKVPICRKSIIQIHAKNRKKAMAFSSKIADFMDIEFKIIN